MVFLYNISVSLISLLFKLAGLFHPKARLFVSGRRNLFCAIETAFYGNQSPVLWVHCASLGEFEQGRPVIEVFRKELPSHKILLTFFSPSGFEVRKNYQGADYIFYLPWDTPTNARKFIQLVNPALAIFVKYEFWYNYSKVLHRNGIPLLSISSIFRSDQLFFQPYGKFYRKTLKHFTHFFVQNETSVKLLQSIQLYNCEKAGDTRFDRVYEIVKENHELSLAANFKAGEKLLVAGSCWPEDLDVIVPLINENRLKFIIAPHEISEAFITTIEKSLQVKSIRYSRAKDQDLQEYSVLIIDNIGLLSKLYRYGEFAYVGGAFGKGLHNILEAACYGVPVFFGNRSYEKFQEATDLINRGGAFQVSDYTDFKMKYEQLNIPENFLLACEVTQQYVEENLGATDKIISFCKKLLKT